MKPVEFRGKALDDLRSFPESARRAAGYQIDRVQRGYEPDDWKAMPTVGKGVSEIRLREGRGKLPGDLSGQARRRRLRVSLFPKEDAEDRSERY